MQLCQINDLQKNILCEMGFGEEIRDAEVKLPELVYSLLATNPQAGELVLGKIGRKLIEFINKVDLNHPDLPHAIDGIFQNNDNARQQVQEAIELADRCKNFSAISPNFHKLIDRNVFSKMFLTDKYFGARLLKSSQERNLIRKNRKIQNVDLRAVYKKGNEIWGSQPNTFEAYNRHNMPFLQEIEISEQKIIRYMDLGCETLADKISKEVRQLRINLSYRYCGFNRITMTVASLILARMHGYKLRTSWDIHDNQVVTIAIQNNLLYDFQPNESELPTTFVTKCSNGYHYEPRSYPVHKMSVSEDMSRLVDHLDSFPDMNGKALFDDLIVLVPSVKLNAYNGTYFIKDLNGNILGFDNQEEAAIFLDKVLIEHGFIQPILLGERDGMCYFLCYWS